MEVIRPPIDVSRAEVRNVIRRRHEIGDDVDAHGGDDEGDRAENHDKRIADLLDDQNRVHDGFAENLHRSRGHDNGDDGEYEEIEGQPQQVAELHDGLILAEAREVAEIEQERREIGDDQHRRVRHHVDGRGVRCRRRAEL
jgi:hypothetical protein